MELMDMEPPRFPSRNAQKDMLLNQSKRCREKLQLLRDLRDNVVNAVNEACVAIETILCDVEHGAEAADSSELKSLSKEIRSAKNMIIRYESALENVIEMADMDDEDDRVTYSSSTDFDRLSAPRGATAVQIAAVSTRSIHLTPVPPGGISMAVATPTVTNTDAELIQLDVDVPPASPEFHTAHSSLAPSVAGSRGSLDRMQTSSTPVAAAMPLVEPTPVIVETVLEPQVPPPSAPSVTPTSSFAQIAAAIVASGFGPSTTPTTPVTAPAVSVSSAPAQQEMIRQLPSEVSYSEGLESSSTSPTNNLITSSDSAVSGDDTFVEGEAVPSGRFSYADDNLVRFYMRHIISPDEFYVQPLSAEITAAFTQLHLDLARFYGDEENRKPLFQDGDSEIAEEKQGMFGVYIRQNSYSSDVDCQRCEVTGWREMGGVNRYRGMQRYEAQIRFIDLGSKQWVPATRIWKIERRFCVVPALTIRCRLFDTRPKDEGSATAFGSWSETAVNKFKSLCDGDRPMAAFVSNKREAFGLMLYSYRGQVKICINTELVAEKLAKTLTNWNRASTISVGDSENRIQTLDQADLSVDFLCFGAECPTLRPPTIRSFVLVIIPKWFTYCRFSVYFIHGVGDITLTQNDPQLKSIYEEPIRKYESETEKMTEMYVRGGNTMAFSQWPLVGQLVASKFSHDDRYYRARLLDVVPQDNTARVRYVDYGNDEWVPIQSLRALSPEFLSLPFMAMECRLAGVRPLPGVPVNDEYLNMMKEHLHSHPSGFDQVLAQVVHVQERRRPAGPILSVILWSKDKTFNFNDEFVAKRWVERDQSA